MERNSGFVHGTWREQLRRRMTRVRACHGCALRQLPRWRRSRAPNRAKAVAACAATGNAAIARGAITAGLCMARPKQRRAMTALSMTCMEISGSRRQENAARCGRVFSSSVTLRSEACSEPYLERADEFFTRIPTVAQTHASAICTKSNESALESFSARSRPGEHLQIKMRGSNGR